MRTITFSARRALSCRRPKSKFLGRYMVGYDTARPQRRAVRLAKPGLGGYRPIHWRRRHAK